MSAQAKPLSDSEPTRYEALQIREALYKKWAEDPTTKDFIAITTAIVEQTKRDLITGTHDRWGHTNDEAKRAVILFGETLLSVPGRAAREAENARRIKADVDRRTSRPGSVHGLDVMSTGVEVNLT